MNMNAAYLLFFVLGLVKAGFFVGIVRWCLKNDMAVDDSGGGSGGTPKDPVSPYTPPHGGRRAIWKVLHKQRKPVQ
jgi:hypothetical protein